MYKQVIVVRTDIKMTPGKLSAQVAHASLYSASKTKQTIRDAWESEGSKKVVLKVSDLAGLKELYKKANSSGLPCFLVRDAGKTQLKSGTITCLGIGPAKERDMNKITKHLKLL